MKIYNSIDSFNLNIDTAITIGKFDGLHRGHKLLCENLFAMEKENLASLVISFVEPLDNVFSKSCEKKLVTNEEKIKLFRDSGIKIFIECLFDETFMMTKPYDFIVSLVDKLNMKCLIVGSDFRFGYKGAGDVSFLKDLSNTLGFQLKVIDKLKYLDLDISSTRIREEITKGHIALANELMGRNYFLYGKVVHGRHIGTRLDFPTINIKPDNNKLIPKCGVYICVVVINNKTYQGITNIGYRPTFDDDNTLSIETHILNFDMDVYGKEVKIVFLKEMRDEKKFDSENALKAQLILDKKQGIDFFTNEQFEKNIEKMC